MAGSHGSLTKAGKVRNQTPKVQARPRKGLTPSLRSKKNYFKRVVKEIPVGQPEFRRS
ncbi:MAG: 30S ribosomal protein S30e [Candidatus Heimdallarchaeota archaeon]